jgi:predicted secreted protein
MEKLPDHLDLAVGQSYSLTLPSAGTSGYIWQETVAGPPGVVGVSWARGFPPGTTPPAVGVAAPETLTIHARQPGEVTLLLEQARPWERGRAPNREERITVRVSKPG